METVLYQHVRTGDQYAVTYDYDGETVIDVANFINGRAREHASNSDRLAMVDWFNSVEYNDDDQPMFYRIRQIDYVE